VNIQLITPILPKRVIYLQPEPNQKHIQRPNRLKFPSLPPENEKISNPEEQTLTKMA